MDKRIAIRLVLALVVALGLLSAGCGFRGPLYLPDEPPGEQTAEPETENVDPETPEEESDDGIEDEDGLAHNPNAG